MWLQYILPPGASAEPEYIKKMSSSFPTLSTTQYHVVRPKPRDPLLSTV